MVKIGECFDINGTTLEVVEINNDEICKVEFIVVKGNNYIREEGFISTVILEKMPTFPF